MSNRRTSALDFIKPLHCAIEALSDELNEATFNIFSYFVTDRNKQIIGHTLNGIRVTHNKYYTNRDGNACMRYPKDYSGVRIQCFYNNWNLYRLFLVCPTLTIICIRCKQPTDAIAFSKFSSLTTKYNTQRMKKGKKRRRNKYMSKRKPKTTTARTTDKIIIREENNNIIVHALSPNCTSSQHYIMKPECATCSHIWSSTEGVRIPQHINQSFLLLLFFIYYCQAKFLCFKIKDFHCLFDYSIDRGVFCQNSESKHKFVWVRIDSSDTCILCAHLISVINLFLFCVKRLWFFVFHHDFHYTICELHWHVLCCRLYGCQT